MRKLAVALLFLAACGTPDPTDTDVAETDTVETDTVETDTVETDDIDPCASCDANADCDDEVEPAVCTCKDGFEGNGETCADIDECATENGGCDENAECENTLGASECTCTRLYEGDGQTCDLWVDEDRRACSTLQAEHPSYTTIARDVALCGGSYSASDLATACHTGWHVCTLSEWTARYPIRTYKSDPSDPDLIGPTLGPTTSWGTDQSLRCGGGVWEADTPLDSRTYNESVCHDPDAGLDSYDGGSYNPWNNGKFLVADDGVTPMQGKNANDAFNCCDWDVTFEAQEVASEGAAVYCCVDE